MAYELDEALAIRIWEADANRRSSTHPTFGRLDDVLAGRGPRFTQDGLRYQDPVALYREEMERRRAEGLVN